MRMIHRIAIITVALVTVLTVRSRAAVSGGCDQWGCGSNTAMVHNKPIGPLHLGGAVNQNGFSIEPTLYKHEGGITKTYKLRIEHGEIVGHGSTAVQLRGNELNGSWFVLRGHEGSKELKVAITNVAVVPLWTLRSSTAQQDSEPAGPEYAFAYELRFPELGREEFACPSVSWGWGPASHPVGFSTKPLARPERYRDYELLSWTKEGRYAVLIKGETYDGSTATVDQSGEKGQSWFNIACNGTALSKMKLMGYDPEEQGAFHTTPAQRQAALKMITARYCGSKSYTKEGQPLVWQNALHWFRPGYVGIKEQDVGEVEASWNSDGAVCLNTPRLPGLLREVVIKECQRKIPTCDASIGLDHVPAKSEWVTLRRN